MVIIIKNYKYILKWILLVNIFFIILYFSIYLYSLITPKMSLTSANQLVYYDNNNESLFSDTLGNKWISIDNISKYVIDGTIATEDKKFYKHIGFDYLRIIKALYNNFINGSLEEGASTISQQYIKNLYLSFDKTWERKIEEAFLAIELEVHYTKDEILEGYLNTIDYSSGNYGIENASYYYFGKSSKDLSLAEASILVGIPKNPSLYNPITNFEDSKERQYLVLLSMYKNNYITKDEMDNAYNEELKFVNSHYEDVYNTVYYYKDAVIEELNSLDISNSIITNGGLKIYTNYDKNYQLKLEKSIKKNMKDDGLQVASIVIEPSTGKIKALVGGKDYSYSEFNRAVNAKRQVGSTIKPILYYAALDNGFTSSSTFLSERTTFNVGNDSFYSPSNYGSVYANKNISLAAAISFSDNIYAVKTHLFLGNDVLQNYSKKMGIKENLGTNASLALGTTEMSMLDFSRAYVTLSNEGTKIEPYLIEKITDMNDNVIYEHKTKKEYVLDKRKVYILNELLTNTYNYSFMSYSSPTLITINGKINHKYAVKSGSTDTDYWTIGYNKDILTLVWVGYDDNTNVQTYQSNICKNIWLDASESILKNVSNTWYDIPSDVTMSYVEPISGNLSYDKNGVFLYYIKGSEPKY